MKPVKITMNAFGPYAEKTVVDMEKLGGQGLYLITGDTGSGKTTIFDAVCYALFGSASGDSRKPDMFRSKYADDSEKTYVEMIFEYNGVRYRVHREPKQLTPKKRGEGFTDLNTVNELYDSEDRVIVSGEKQLDNKIKEILGLDLGQYRNIAMIAQGSFAQLLTAGTESRTKILSAIFSTGRFYRLQMRLAEDMNRVNNEYRSSNVRIKNILEGIRLSADSPHISELSQAIEKAEAAEFTQLTDICRKAGDYENEQTKAAEKEFKAADKANKNAALKYDSDKKLNSLFERKSEIEKSCESIAPRLDEAAKEATKQQALRPEISRLIGEIAAEKGKLGDYDSAEILLKSVNDLTKAAKASEKDRAVMAHKLEEDKNSLQKANKLLEELFEVKAELAETAHLLTAQKEKLDEIKALGSELRAVTDMGAKVSELKTVLEGKKTDCNNANSVYMSVYNAYIDNQAGLIARELKADQPCPVCGSTSHPRPAVIPENAPDKNDADKAFKSFERARKELDKASGEFIRVKADYENAAKNVSERSKKHLGIAEPDKAILEARDKYTHEAEKLRQITAKLDELQKKQKLRSDTEEHIKKLEKDIELLSENIKKAESDALRASTAAEEKQAAAQKLIKELKYQSKAEALKNISMLESRKNDMEKALADAEKQLRELEKTSTELKGKLAELENQTKNKQPPELEAAENELKQTEQTVKAALKKRDEAKGCLASCDDALKRLEKELAVNTQLSREFSMKSSLSRTANGLLSQKHKITLETYVQMEYFSRILELANVRLLQMTNGQYELIRSERTNGGKKVGLDIDVIDHFSASVRSVGSLSGGESFMASLALALGFSDEIQQSSGGIRIDSMFVDEGFGSLDDESLDQAVKTLSSLAENSRLVGIISHVPELKEKLDKRIIVTKDRTAGSRIEISC